MSRVLYVPTKEELLTRKELVILSTTLGFAGFAAVSYPISNKEAIELLKNARKLYCYHGHQPTLDVINQIVGTDLKASRVMYVPKDGEVALAIKLNKRLRTFGTEAVPRLQDLEFALVFYRKL